jgi:hypothetical protein
MCDFWLADIALLVLWLARMHGRIIARAHTHARARTRTRTHTHTHTHTLQLLYRGIPWLCVSIPKRLRLVVTVETVITTSTKNTKDGASIKLSTRMLSYDLHHHYCTHTCVHNQPSTTTTITTITVHTRAFISHNNLFFICPVIFKTCTLSVYHHRLPLPSSQPTINHHHHHHHYCTHTWITITNDHHNQPSTTTTITTITVHTRAFITNHQPPPPSPPLLYTHVHNQPSTTTTITTITVHTRAQPTINHHHHHHHY